MSSSIIGLGTSLAQSVIPQQTASQWAKQLCCADEKQSKLLERVYAKSEINTRTTVLPFGGEEASRSSFYPRSETTFDTGPSTAKRMEQYEILATPLATSASLAALHDATIAPEQITHLVTVSCTGFAAPGFDLQLFDRLKLRPSVSRTHLGFMGCHGAMNAFKVASAFCAESSENVVLVCATELCSLHFQYGWSKQLLVSNSLFADGAAAAIFVSSKQSSNERKSPHKSPRYHGAASYVVPDSTTAMTWKIGDSGFIMTLASNVPELIEQNLPLFISSWLAQHGLKVADVKGWAVHPGGPRILDAVEHALALDPDALSASRQILSECGNMSSPTVLFILQRLLAVGNASPCVMLGFGPGLTIEAALIY